MNHSPEVAPHTAPPPPERKPRTATAGPDPELQAARDAKARAVQALKDAEVAEREAYARSKEAADRKRLAEIEPLTKPDVFYRAIQEDCAAVAAHFLAAVTTLEELEKKHLIPHRALNGEADDLRRAIGERQHQVVPLQMIAIKSTIGRLLGEQARAANRSPYQVKSDVADCMPR